jgi:DNA polymerase elongation subunit (family B)
MFQKINLEKVLFLDIETVPEKSQFDELSEEMKILWKNKSILISKDNVTPKEAYSRAGIYAEFGKLVCISVGIIRIEKGIKTLRVKSFSNHNEKEILQDFFKVLNKHYSSLDTYLCAHNGKEFDFPYIARRALINGINIPATLDLAGKKPWEVKHIDTLHLWKFGDYKHYTSLSLLAAIFKIPTPKDDIDGSMVGQVYWEENNLLRISQYCEKDVVALSQLFLRFRNENIIATENIYFT